ncbi:MULTISPECIES: hypothetical protein [unclassified Acinetobacter]|uniref:hypothetical protein n=1 Tax=unclassified Acinetobacter TaxID=196816 RepID=UPI00287D4F0B|nr:MULTISPECIES: hypothetical protein [unclassified Acinetobacter]MDS7956793.1 hypothetical protein [Acinetobacter sp. V104_13]MDS7984318.1 hypothetical protein [Acinetobacter sp. V104_3]
MVFFDYVIPGTWIDYDDEEWSIRIFKQILMLESQFQDANVALDMFSTLDASKLYPFSREKFAEDSSKKYEIRNFLEKKIPREGMSEYDYQLELSLQTDIQFKKEQWSNGKKPIGFEISCQRIYARAFINALDLFDRVLQRLTEEKGIPSGVVQQYEKISKYFPDLRPVRNTMQHLEDRSRGKGAYNKQMDLKPIDNDYINAPNGGVLVLDTLNGSNFESTMANGEIGRVEISCESLSKLLEILVGVLNSFKWKGPKQHRPLM